MQSLIFNSNQNISSYEPFPNDFRRLNVASIWLRKCKVYTHQASAVCDNCSSLTISPKLKQMPLLAGKWTAIKHSDKYLCCPVYHTCGEEVHINQSKPTSRWDHVEANWGASGSRTESVVLSVTPGTPRAILVCVSTFEPNPPNVLCDPLQSTFTRLAVPGIRSS